MILLKDCIFAIFLIIAASQDSKAGSVPQGKNIILPTDPAALARYLVHNSDWASVGSISTIESIKGYPFIGIVSISDGPKENGTGKVYMYVTDRDPTLIDLQHDSRTTLFMSLAQGTYCKEKNYDPEDPRCSRIMLTGNLENVEEDTDEYNLAQNALFSRHPSMRHWPVDHKFHFVTLDIKFIQLFSGFGGIKIITKEDYLAASL